MNGQRNRLVNHVEKWQIIRRWIQEMKLWSEDLNVLEILVNIYEPLRILQNLTLGL